MTDTSVIQENVDVQIQPTQISEPVEPQQQTLQSPAREYTVKKIVKYSEEKTNNEKTAKIEVIVDSLITLFHTFLTTRGVNMLLTYAREDGLKFFKLSELLLLLSTIVVTGAIAAVYGVKTYNAKKELDDYRTNLDEQQILKIGERLEHVTPTETEYYQISHAIHEHNYEKAEALLDQLEMKQSQNKLSVDERTELENYRGMSARFNTAVANHDQSAINAIAQELMMAGKNNGAEEQKGQQL